MSKTNRDTDRRCRLNKSQVAEIRDKYMNTNTTHKALAQEYGVAPQTINFICSPGTYKKAKEATNKRYRRKCEENMRNKQIKSTELKHEVLMVLIRTAVDIMPGAEIIPSTYIARLLKKPIRDIRKALKELENEGFIRYGYEGGWNEYSERPFCIWGYCITQKAMELPEYKEAEEEEKQIIQEIWFGGADNDEK